MTRYIEFFEAHIVIDELGEFRDFQNIVESFIDFRVLLISKRLYH